MELTLQRPDHIPLPMAAPGTCIPCCDNAREWWVKARGEGWHRVNADTGACTCLGYLHRRACRHGKELGEVLSMQKALQAAAPITTARIERQVTGKAVEPRIAGMTQAELRSVFA